MFGQTGILVKLELPNERLPWRRVIKRHHRMVEQWCLRFAVLANELSGLLFDRCMACWQRQRAAVATNRGAHCRGDALLAKNICLPALAKAALAVPPRFSAMRHVLRQVFMR